jgi:hypothetical protein
MQPYSHDRMTKEGLHTEDLQCVNVNFERIEYNKSSLKYELTDNILTYGAYTKLCYLNLSHVL